MIEHYNVSLINFLERPEAKKLEEVEISGLPVVFRRGAVDISIGAISHVRKGRDEMFGEVVLELEGAMEFDPDTGKPVKFVYQKEKSG